MTRLREGVAARLCLTMAGLSLCVAMAGCALPGTIRSAFSRPLHIVPPIQTSPGNFTVSADDASAAVANAAALQQAAMACAALGLTSRTINSSASANDGRHYFTLNFQCQ